MAEDEGSFRSDAEVSSTVVLPELILIPAPVRASVHTQQAVKGRGTKNHPYELDFMLEPNGSNTVSGYLRSGPFPAFSSHLLWSPVNSHQLLETLVGVSFISLFVISWTRIM